jgi:hypothetical protein
MTFYLNNDSVEVKIVGHTFKVLFTFCFLTSFRWFIAYRAKGRIRSSCVCLPPSFPITFYTEITATIALHHFRTQ